eukprot:4789858-Pyramimonas_sp.AAC.1
MLRCVGVLDSRAALSYRLAVSSEMKTSWHLAGRHETRHAHIVFSQAGRITPKRQPSGQPGRDHDVQLRGEREAQVHSWSEAQVQAQARGPDTLGERPRAHVQHTFRPDSDVMDVRNIEDVLTFNVRGERFKVAKRKLRAFPESLLATLVTAPTDGENG